MTARMLIILVAVLSLVGCANTSKPDTMDEQVHIQPMDQAEAQLAEAAASASQSLVVLAEVRQASSPVNHIPEPVDPSRYGMGQLVVVDWTGPIEPLATKIAQITHYKLSILGKKPAAPIVVTIHERNVPVGTVLRNAGYQCGQRANLVIFPNARTIELRYKQA